MMPVTHPLAEARAWLTLLRTPGLGPSGCASSSPNTAQRKRPLLRPCAMRTRRARVAAGAG